VVVFPAGQSSIDARGTADGVMVTWLAPNQPIVRKKLPGQAWGAGGGMCCASPPWNDTSGEPETVYLYRMEAYDGKSWSPADVGMRIAFTDDALAAGMMIRAVHLQEIVRAANILRQAAGLTLVPTGNIVSGTVVAAAHVSTLRNAINEARLAIGAAAFPFTGTVAPGALISAHDVQELREAVR